MEIDLCDKHITAMKSLLYLAGFMTGLVFTACTSDDSSDQNHKSSSKEVVNILTRSPEANSANSTIKAGLYMVNYKNGVHAELERNENYVNNLQLDYSDGTWIPQTPIYWQNTDVCADFYAYAPFNRQVNDSRAMAFSVETNQTSDDAWQKSDLLWGSVQGQSPMDGQFNLMLTHQLSQLIVKVTPGEGFGEGELTDENVSVTISGSKTSGTIDLQSGTVTATADIADIHCNNKGNLTYAAILLPQFISNTHLVQINWNNNNYTLDKSFLLEANKQYTITIKLKKTQGGLDVGIENWDVIDEDFGGTVG